MNLRHNILRVLSLLVTSILFAWAIMLMSTQPAKERVVNVVDVDGQVGLEPIRGDKKDDV